MVIQSGPLLVCSECTPLFVNSLKNMNELHKSCVTGVAPNELVSPLSEHFARTVHIYENTQGNKKCLWISGLQFSDSSKLTFYLILFNCQFFSFFCCWALYLIFALCLDCLYQKQDADNSLPFLHYTSWGRFSIYGYTQYAVIKIHLSPAPCPLFYKVWSGTM